MELNNKKIIKKLWSILQEITILWTYFVFLCRNMNEAPDDAPDLNEETSVWQQLKWK